MIPMTTYPARDVPYSSSDHLIRSARNITRALIDGFGSAPQIPTVREVIRDEGLNQEDSQLLEVMVQKLISTAVTTITLDDKALEGLAL